MSKPTPALLAIAAVLVGVTALAQRQNPPATPAPNPETQNRSVVGTQLMSGTVWDYAPGQSITLKAGDGKEYKMPLRQGVSVAGIVKVGQLAAVMWMTDNAGGTRVMSITGPPGAPSDIERSAPGMGSPPPATAVPNVTPSGSGTPGLGGAAPRSTPRTAGTPAPGTDGDRWTTTPPARATPATR
jgi:hypothetical protein